MNILCYTGAAGGFGDILCCYKIGLIIQKLGHRVTYHFDCLKAKLPRGMENQDITDIDNYDYIFCGPIPLKFPLNMKNVTYFAEYGFGGINLGINTNCIISDFPKNVQRIKNKYSLDEYFFMYMQMNEDSFIEFVLKLKKNAVIVFPNYSSYERTFGILEDSPFSLNTTLIIKT